MTIQECYDEIGGDYAEVLHRLMTPNLVKKFIAKFLDDGSYQHLCDFTAARDRGEAFRAAHTLKGVCQNLGLGDLSRSSGKITELLRAETEEFPEEAVLMLEDVKRDYEKTTLAIRRFLTSETEK